MASSGRQKLLSFDVMPILQAPLPLRLGAVSEIEMDPEKGVGAKGYALPVPKGTRPDSMFVVCRRAGETTELFGYLNDCPHVNTTLDWAPDKFLSWDKRMILCATHGAQFRIDDGYCVAGPCVGQGLIPVTVTLDGDEIMLISMTSE